MTDELVTQDHIDPPEYQEAVASLRLAQSWLTEALESTDALSWDIPRWVERSICIAVDAVEQAQLMLQSLEGKAE